MIKTLIKIGFMAMVIMELESGRRVFFFLLFVVVLHCCFASRFLYFLSIIFFRRQFCYVSPSSCTVIFINIDYRSISVNNHSLVDYLIHFYCLLSLSLSRLLGISHLFCLILNYYYFLPYFVFTFISYNLTDIYSHMIFN